MFLRQIGRPGYKVTKSRDAATAQRSLLFEVDYPEADDASQPHTARFPAKQAACRGVPPPPSTPVTGTPRSTSHCAVLSWPANAAKWSALPPFFARTLASGSSAVAAFSVARRMGWIDEQATVQMPGGELAVEQRADGGLLQTGPVEEIGELVARPSVIK